MEGMEAPAQVVKVVAATGIVVRLIIVNAPFPPHRYMYPLGIDRGREGLESKPPSRSVSRSHHFEPPVRAHNRKDRRHRLPLSQLIMSPRIANLLGLPLNRPLSRQQIQKESLA